MPVSWKVIGNRPVLDRLTKAIKDDRLHHAYLFTGAPHVGKTTVATRFAQAIICERDEGPCGECTHCSLFLAGNHPDYLSLSDEGSLSINDIRDLKEALTLKAHSAARRVAVIPQAERLGIPAQNALLKVLEEPPPGAVLILTAASAASLLPTTVSRCQHLHFSVPSAKELQDGLADRGEAASEAARMATRRPGLALQLLAEPDQLTRRREWGNMLTEAITADTASRLQLADRLAKEESLGDLLDTWLAFHRDALYSELGEADQLPPESVALAKHYGEPQLRHNITALFAARQRLDYNPNVLLLMENTLLALGE